MAKKPTHPADDIIGVPEAANILGCTTARVRQLLADGSLEGRKITSRAWILLRKDVLALANSPRAPVGRPRIADRAAGA